MVGGSECFLFRSNLRLVLLGSFKVGLEFAVDIYCFLGFFLVGGLRIFLFGVFRCFFFVFGYRGS